MILKKKWGLYRRISLKMQNFKLLPALLNVPMLIRTHKYRSTGLVVQPQQLMQQFELYNQVTGFGGELSSGFSCNNITQRRKWVWN